MGRAHEVRKQSMEKTAAAKSALYGRAAKEIYMAAKNGSTDPEANLALRSAMDKAKSKQVPADVIQRAIKRAEGGDAESYTSNRYEGYGPGNSMIIVDSLTTNVNRAIAEIRDAFNKNGGKLANAGAVSHSFQSTSVFAFENLGVEEVLELLMETDADVQDVVEEDGLTVVYAAFQSFNSVKTALDKAGVTDYKMAETTMLADENMKIDDEETKQKFEKLIDRLNELEDVQDVYHNVED
ncbi:YebC/PmpR family DNA-binding transcriptional regulator [Spiroplasma chinense]|uniref:Probable transcriptional regulatory protein SCHIN_v1c04080 n=1 Tax=Spiroplasma chinense TaxID=216932 RepID=A0A5B9Y478_9MOLU|nr:YebC/PmpR family DNA-binding transcriptional regulator [Spiroplasma chinense]QEH61605.1 YebC/PmpR family DNA-binding transcriptional regulator [Spiroplasma chinense]